MVRLVLFLTAFAVLAGPAAADPLAEGATALVGVAAPGAFTALPIPVDYSFATPSALTPDGRYVVFTSASDGLVADDDDAVSNVYLKDRQSGGVELISRRSGADGAPADADCLGGSVSDDGNLVAFTCDGPLLATDTNGAQDVYLRNRSAQTTAQISRTKFVIGDDDSYEPMISGNGAYVVFTSLASNLVATSLSGSHVFRKDLASPQPELVDRTPTANVAPNGSADTPTISTDGLRIAFLSSATNLVAGLTGDDEATDAFWRDYRTGTPATALAGSRNGDTAHALNSYTSDAQISADGDYVVFSTGASDIADGDTDSGTNIHRRTLAGNAVVLVDRADGSNGTKPFSSDLGGVSANGDTVLFHTIDALDGGQALNQVYARVIGTGKTVLVSRGSGAGPAAADVASPQAVSGDGSVLLFSAKGLSADADPATAGLFVRVGTDTSLVSRPAGTDPFINLGSDARLYGTASLSADGRFALYSAKAPGLPGARTGTNELWRRDTLTGDVVLVSRGPGPDGAAAATEVLSGAISDDGNRVAFSVTNDDLGGGALNPGIYVRDIAAGTTVVASRGDGGAGTGTGYSLSADGRHVGFVSADPAITGGGPRGAFVRDVDAGVTQRFPGLPGVTPVTVDVSADGHRAAVATRDPDPTDPSSLPAEFDHIYAVELGGGVPKQLDVPSGAKEEAHNATISDDGSRVAFTSKAALVPADTHAGNDVYVADVADGALTLATVTGQGTVADGFPFGPQISGDGTHVSFISSATNIAGRGARVVDPGVPKAYVRDLSAGTTRLASVGVASQPVDAVAIDRTGGCAVYQTADTALAPGLPTGVQRVWLHALAGTCPVIPPKVTATPSPTASPVPTVVPVRRTKPKVTRFTAKPKRFKTRGKKRGTRFTFTLDQPATVKIVVARLVKKKAKKVATLRLKGKRGKNTIRFRKKHLRRGRYRATLTATSAGGTSKAKTLRLRAR